MAKSKNEYGPFYFVNLMKTGDYDPSEHDKFYSPFIISRYLSADVRLIPFLNRINLYDPLDKKVHFNFCKTIVSYVGGNVYTAYTKEGLSLKSKDTKTKDSIVKFFEVGDNDFESIVENLSEKEIDEILKYMERNHLA